MARIALDHVTKLYPGGVDLDGPALSQRVQADANSAVASGARGTPTLFINGRLHLAGYDEATLGAALASAIKER